MMLDHEGLEVYQVALDFLIVANAIIEGLPLDEKDPKAGKERVSRIVSMLVKLARSCEDG